MAGYTKTKTFVNGDTIIAEDFNTEFTNLNTAFSSTGGHNHDGTAGGGKPLSQLGDSNFYNRMTVNDTTDKLEFAIDVGSSSVIQIQIQDGAIVPETNNDIDLGTSGNKFKDGYFAGNIVGAGITATSLTMGDSEKIILGAGGDLEIFHQAIANESGYTHSSHILEKGDGHLFIDANHFAVRTGDANPEGNDSSPTDYNRILSTGASAGGTVFCSGIESPTGTDPSFLNRRMYIKPTVAGSYRGGVDVYGDMRLLREDYAGTGIGGGRLEATSIKGITGGGLATTLSIETAIEVTGTVTADGIKVGTNENILLGTDDNFKIFTDGINSFVRETGANGNLVLDGEAVSIRQHKAIEDASDLYSRYLYAQGGSVKLYHQTVDSENSADNAYKLKTTSTGIDVKGQIDLSAGSYTTTIAEGTLSGNITVTLPALTGTLALTTDTVSGATNATNATNIAVSGSGDTNATYYITYASATSGNLPAKVDSNLTFNPSTNLLTAQKLNTDSIVLNNSTALTSVDTDISNVSGSDDTLASAKAIKDYVDSQIASASDGDITSVTAGTGLTDGGASGDVTLNIGAGTGITVNTDDIALNLAGLTDMTGDVDGNSEVIINDNGTPSRKLFSEIKVSAFNNDVGFTTNAGTVTGVSGGVGIDVTGGTSAATVTLDLNELNTSTGNDDGDYFAVVDDAGAQKKLTKGNINISGFNNDSGFTANTGTVTSVSSETGISVDNATNAAIPKVSLDIAGLSVTTGTVAAFAIVEGTDTKKILPASIPLSAFNNDSGFTTDAGTVTSVTATSPVSSTGGATPNISLAASSAVSSGSMSSTHYTKLEGIAAGATANVGDITQVSAGTGCSGGGTSGSVTISVAGGDGLTAEANGLKVDSTVIRTTGNQSMAGAKTFTDPVAITTTNADNENTLVLTDNEQGTTARPILKFDRTSASPENNDELSRLTFHGKKANNTGHEYARISVVATSVDNNSPTGAINFFASQNNQAGGFKNVMTVENSGVTVRGSLTADSFKGRVETAINTTLVDYTASQFIDAANSRIIWRNPTVSSGQVDITLPTVGTSTTSTTTVAETTWTLINGTGRPVVVAAPSGYAIERYVAGQRMLTASGGNITLGAYGACEIIAGELGSNIFIALGSELS